MPTIGLLWHSLRSANLGWGAMTLSHLAMLNKAASAAGRDISFCVIDVFNGPLWYSTSASVAPDEVVIGGEALTQMDALISAVNRAIANCDLVVDIGGGDMFSDIYGEDVLSMVVESRLAVLGQRKRLILGPQTIGPFKTTSARSQVAYILRRCEKVFTRDSWSTSLLKELGVVHNAEETIDLAFRLPFTRKPCRTSETIRLGLNVSGLLYWAAEMHQLEFYLQFDYPSLINKVIEYLLRRNEVSVILIPHVIGQNKADDDLWICRALSEKFGLALSPAFTSPVEAKSYISELDILVGSRMHATIAAVSSGVAAVPLAYSTKFRGVFESLNYPFVCDLTSQGSEDVIESIQDAIDRISELRAAAEASSEVAQLKLNRYQEYLDEVMRSLP